MRTCTDGENGRANERLAGRHPSRGVELCVIVEMMHSLAVSNHVGFKPVLRSLVPTSGPWSRWCRGGR